MPRIKRDAMEYMYARHGICGEGRSLWWKARAKFIFWLDNLDYVPLVRTRSRRHFLHLDLRERLAYWNGKGVYPVKMRWFEFGQLWEGWYIAEIQDGWLYLSESKILNKRVVRLTKGPRTYKTANHEDSRWYYYGMLRRKVWKVGLYSLL